MDKTKVIKSIVIALLFSVVVYYVYVIFFMGTLPPIPELIDLF